MSSAKIIGTVIPGYSSLAEPSAQEIAHLEDAIRALSVRVIFVGSTVNSVIAARVTEDTGTQILPIYSDSLSTADGPAATYLAMMRYNVAVIVEALQE